MKHDSVISHGRSDVWNLTESFRMGVKSVKYQLVSSHRHWICELRLSHFTCAHGNSLCPCETYVNGPMHSGIWLSHIGTYQCDPCGMIFQCSSCTVRLCQCDSVIDAKHSTWAHTCEAMHMCAYMQVILHGRINANHFTKGAYMRINLQGAHTCVSYATWAHTCESFCQLRKDANQITRGA